MAAFVKKINFSRVKSFYKLNPCAYASGKITIAPVVATARYTPVRDVRSVHYDVIRHFQTSASRSCHHGQHGAAGEQQEQSENAEDDSAPMSEEEIKLVILNSALQFVPEHGWSTQAISAGAECEGLPGVSHGMFPRGGVELVEYFYHDCNHRLADRLAEEAHRQTHDGGKIKVTAFVRDAVEHRLRMIHPFMDSWPEAMGLQALPQNAPKSWQRLMSLCDDIWYYAGDKSTDSSWYTKRLSLAYVYKATEVYMLQDQSDDFTDTWAFLDARLDDIKTLGKTLSQGQNIIQSAFQLAKAASTVGANMAGLNRHDRRTR